MGTLNTIRDRVPATTRGRVYSAVALVAPALIAWGLLDEQQAAAIGGVALAVVTLVYALIHGTSAVANALYGVLAALAVVASVWGYGSADQWQSLLAPLGIAFGVTVAAARTPAADEPVESGTVDVEF